MHEFHLCIECMSWCRLFTFWTVFFKTILSIVFAVLHLQYVLHCHVLKNCLLQITCTYNMLRRQLSISKIWNTFTCACDRFYCIPTLLKTTACTFCISLLHIQYEVIAMHFHALNNFYLCLLRALLQPERHLSYMNVIWMNSDKYCTSETVWDLSFQKNIIVTQ